MSDIWGFRWGGPFLNSPKNPFLVVLPLMKAVCKVMCSASKTSCLSSPLITFFFLPPRPSPPLPSPPLPYSLACISQRLHRCHSPLGGERRGGRPGEKRDHWVGCPPRSRFQGSHRVRQDSPPAERPPETTYARGGHAQGTGRQIQAEGHCGFTG